MAFTNDVSFSVSRESMLAECPRRYWYSVYLMWNGWWSNGVKPEPRRAQAYAAKHATTEEMLAGEIVHGMAEWAIRQSMKNENFLEKWGGLDGIRQHMLAASSRQIDEALAQARAPVRGNPKKWVTLVSVLNGEEAREDALRDRVRTRIESLCSPNERWAPKPYNLLMRAIEARDRIVHVEDLIEFQIAGMKAYVKHDLVVRHPSSPSYCTIIDWKTGRELESSARQVEFYAAWAALSGWKRVDTALVYLGESSAMVTWDAPALDEAIEASRNRVENFGNQLAHRLLDGDLKRNKPIEELFQPTTDASKCRGCPHASMCARDGTKPSSG